MNYNDLQNKHSEEFDKFEGLFFAFSNDQFKEGLAKLNLSEGEKVVSVGAGGYVRKTKVDELTSMIDRHKEEKEQFKKEKKNLLDCLAYELRNHEYGYTYDVTDALEALGLKLEDIPADILKQAKKLAA